MTPNSDWSIAEVELIVSDYFMMLQSELVGKPLNKTHHRNGLKMLLRNRSDGSIEYKHQNISAVLIKLGLPFIKGYKPKWNYQQVLEQKVIEYLSNQRAIIEPKFNQFSEHLVSGINKVSFANILDSPPERQLLVSEPEIEFGQRPIKINYLEKEQSNHTLGESGEMLALEYERWRLIDSGKESLADKVEWIAQKDDGAGFDILSKNINGTDRYIEVKTTKLTKDSPIFFSKSEYEFSLSNKESYYLYRLFNFEKNPKLFTVRGSFDQFCDKEAIQFKGYF